MKTTKIKIGMAHQETKAPLQEKGTKLLRAA
jgi:hypothetical protein